MSESERARLWKVTVDSIEAYFTSVPNLPVKQKTDLSEVRANIAKFQFESATPTEELLKFVIGNLLKHQTHFAHPSYFGLFDPATTPHGVVADAIVAAFNPQLGASFQSVFPIELEQHLLRTFASEFGFRASEGTFTSGGAEANHTALLNALTHHFPQFREGGVRNLTSVPIVYVSREAHHSFLRAARVTGLGDKAVREVKVDRALRLDPADLRQLIQEDRRAGRLPFFVVGTVGTTKAGAIDPLASIAAVAKEENLWFHAVDFMRMISHQRNCVQASSFVKTL